ncbi:MAG: hypothetical protein PHG97_01800, partial [Candidatus Margulisbacteria bacterium]|nr:hypothetical protein [Candidatus Margulisiibacteriota bacterium]
MIVGLGLVSHAQQGVFLPIYFVQGNLIHQLGPNTPINHNVLFYQLTPQTYGVNQNFTGSTGLNNKFPYLINVFRSQYFGAFNLSPGTYKIGVPTGADGYGADPVDIVISGNGFDTKDLNLVLGGGGGLLPPAGTLALQIARNGADVEVTWDSINNKNVQIFARVGDGTGKFSNTPGDWVQVVKDDVLVNNPLPPGSFAIAAGKLTHKKQVGVDTANLAEVYYRGLKQGIVASAISNDPNFPNPPGTTYIASAWPVGKVNVNVTSGPNLFATPFTNQSAAISNALFTQIDVNNVEVYQFDDQAKTYTKATFTGGNWTYVGGPAEEIKPGNAFWVKNWTGILTVMGNNINQQFTRTIYPGANLLGSPSARGMDLGQAGLLPKAGHEMYLFD